MLRDLAARAYRTQLERDALSPATALIERYAADKQERDRWAKAKERAAGDEGTRRAFAALGLIQPAGPEPRPTLTLRGAIQRNRGEHVDK